MRTILTLLLALSAWTLQAQSLQPQVLANGGMHGETPGGVGLCWTLGGQIETTTISNGTTTLTQGFIQPEYCVSMITDISNIEYDINVYPNPTDDFLFIQLKPGSTVTARLITPLGQQVWTAEINEAYQLATSTLQKQVYFLQFISDKGDLIGTYKILKK